MTKWLCEGAVEKVKGKCFIAEFKCLTDKTEPRFMATIDKKHVPKFYHDLIEEGALFYWYIYVKKGWKKGRSIFKFLRLKPFTQEDIDRACAWAKEMMKELDENSK